MKELKTKKKSTLRGFFKKEFMQALRDPRMRFMLIVTPMIQMTLFGLALSSDVKNIRLAVEATSGDPILYDMNRDALGSKWFVKARNSSNIELKGFDYVRSGKAEAALFAPPGGLTKSYEKGVGQLQALIDSADLVRARSIEFYIRSVLAESIDDYTGDSTPAPLVFNTRVLYNPGFVSAYYLVPGVMCMLTTIITIMLTSMSISKEKEVGTFEMLISAPVKASEILLGKTVPFLVIGIINMPLIMLIATVGFGVPMRGSIFELAIALFFFLITTVSIGTLISTISRSQQQAMMGGFIFLMPAILLSGIMFPVENMPLSFQIVAKFNPLMYFITLLRNIMLKGGDTGVLLKNTLALAGISLFSVSAAFKRFKLHLE